MRAYPARGDSPPVFPFLSRFVFNLHPHQEPRVFDEEDEDEEDGKDEDYLAL